MDHKLTQAVTVSSSFLTVSMGLAQCLRMMPGIKATKHVFNQGIGKETCSRLRVSLRAWGRT